MRGNKYIQPYCAYNVLMVSRSIRILFWLIIVVFSWLLLTAANIWHHGAQDYAQKSDVIIVLGAAAYHKTPSPVFQARIDHAILLYQQGTASTLIFTGGFGKGAPYAESEVAEQYAIRHDVKSSDILIETQSLSTIENLSQAKALMQMNDLSSAIIVSDPFHLKRAALIAKRLGINAVTSPTTTTRYRSFKPKLEFLARETYFYNRYLITHQ